MWGRGYGLGEGRWREQAVVRPDKALYLHLSVHSPPMHAHSGDIQRFTSNGIVLGSGAFLPTDMVVYCTGWVYCCTAPGGCTAVMSVRLYCTGPMYCCTLVPCTARRVCVGGYCSMVASRSAPGGEGGRWGMGLAAREPGRPGMQSMQAMQALVFSYNELHTSHIASQVHQDVRLP